MTKDELKAIRNLNPNQNLIITLNIETDKDSDYGYEGVGITSKGVYNVAKLNLFLNLVDKIIFESDEIHYDSKVFDFHILDEDVVSLSFNQFIEAMKVELITEEEATILHKYNAFSADHFLQLTEFEDLLIDQYQIDED